MERRYFPNTQSFDLDVPEAHRTAAQVIMAAFPDEWDSVVTRPYYAPVTKRYGGIGLFAVRDGRYAGIVLSDPPQVVEHDRIQTLVRMVQRAFARNAIAVIGGGSYG